MSEWKAKRFWKVVEVVEVETGFSVSLDARPVKTPAKRLLSTPTRSLAEAVAQEWRAQEDVIDPNTMPFTRSVNSALDKVAQQHAEVAEMLAAYGDSDLLCYRADAPAELVARQAAEWDPMLVWARDTLGAALEPRVGVMHVPQDAVSLKRLSDLTHDLNPFELAAFHDLVSLSGSLILAFAAIHDVNDAETIWKCSRLDEIWQAEQWGEDDEAEALSEIKKAAFFHAKHMFDLCRADL